MNSFETYDNMDNTEKKKFKTRQRGENWTQAEKILLTEIMRQTAPIIECKKTDTNTNKQKKYEWLKVQKKLEELSGMRRDVIQIKGFWRRLKLLAKTNNKQSLKLTSNGHRPQCSTHEETKIKAISPTDINNDKNDFDRIGFFLKKDHATEQEGMDYTEHMALNKGIVHHIEIKNEIQNEINSSFVDEIITDTDVANKEVKTEKRRKSDDRLKITHSENKQSKSESSHKTSIVESNINIKRRTIEFIEEEYSLKIQFQKRELCHQETRHKLEIELLLLEKEKREMELKILKKSLE